MGLGTNRGYAQYNEPEPAPSLRSLSARRAAIISWHNLHPHSFRLFQKADRQLDQTHGKVRAYNETINSLRERAGKADSEGGKLPLIASIARISGLKEAAERKLAEQTAVRQRLAQHLYDWRETLPLLDGEITLARKQPRD